MICSPFDFGEHFARRGAGARVEKTGDVENHKGQDDERKAPLEPGLVAPHPVEHRHSEISDGNMV